MISFFSLTKDMRKKLIIAAITIIGAIYAISQANILLNFSDINIPSFGDNFSSVHFMTPGNNFVGGIFRLPTTSLSPITISLGSHHKTCTKQVRGIYFNSQRGKRLRPLDQETLELLRQQNASYNDLDLQGGLYTTCDSGNNYGIFGAITYERGHTTSYLVAGTKLEYASNKIQPYMANSFQYFDNKTPIGYLYDSNGGIGYVGGMLTGHAELIDYLNNGGTIQSGFTYSGDYIIASNPNRETIIESGNAAMETMRNMIVQGSVGLSKSIDEKERISLLGNTQDKTIIYNGSDINSSTVINFAKRKAQSLCEGKELNQPISTNANILCYENTDVAIDLDQPSEYGNKTIIVKSGNVILINNMNNTSPAIDLFIDKGTLSLPADPITLQDFDENGFPTSGSGTNAGLYLKGNFIINGLIIGNGNTTFGHTLHLQGKITLLNTPLTPNQGRIDQIQELLGPGYDAFISLQNVFTRTCGLSGTAINDGTPCGQSSVISRTPLVILNGNYSSDLLQ